MLLTDVHLVRYAKDGAEKSAIRAYKYVEIFDELYDQGYTVLEIKRGFGRIKPKLYNAKSMRLALDIETDGLIRKVSQDPLHRGPGPRHRRGSQVHPPTTKPA